MTLEEIEKLYSETTPGKWTYCFENSSDCSLRIYSEFQDTRICGLYQRNLNFHDAEFISAVHNIMPKLIAVTKAAKKYVNQIQQRRPEFVDYETLANLIEDLEKA